jgi:hypothetical protein
VSRDFQEITLVIGLFSFIGMIGTVADISMGKLNIVGLGLLATSCTAFYLSLK